MTATYREFLLLTQNAGPLAVGGRQLNIFFICMHRIEARLSYCRNWNFMQITELSGFRPFNIDDEHRIIYFNVTSGELFLSVKLMRSIGNHI